MSADPSFTGMSMALFMAVSQTGDVRESGIAHRAVPSPYFQCLNMRMTQNEIVWLWKITSSETRDIWVIPYQTDWTLVCRNVVTWSWWVEAVQAFRLGVDYAERKVRQ